MLTTKMSPSMNTSQNFLESRANSYDQSVSRSLQLPPLSHLLNKSVSTSSIPHSINSAPVSPAASRLPSISDLISNKAKVQTSSAPASAAAISPTSSSSSPTSPPLSQQTPVKNGSYFNKAAAAAVGTSEKRAYAFISHSPATFPSHEPSIDNAQLARRKRRRTSPNELSILQHEFEAGHTPNKARRQEIASRVNMTEKAVQIWFQNKRQALRKAQANDHSIHQTTTITLPEVDVATSPLRSTPTKYIDGNSDVQDSFATSPISATSSLSSTELPNISAVPQSYPHPHALPLPHHLHAAAELRSSPPHSQPNLPQVSLPPRPATWTMMTPAKFAPVTPVRDRYQSQTPQQHQLPTPNIMSFRLNKNELLQKNTSKPIPSFTNALPTPSSVKNKPTLKTVIAADSAETRSPSPVNSKVKAMMSLNNLNSPMSTEVTSLAAPTQKRIALGDITNTQNKSASTDSKKEIKKVKKEGEFECVENLLSLRAGNWK